MTPILFSSFLPSHLLSSPFFFSLPPVIVVTQIRGHIAGSSPPTRYGSCLAFLSREDFSSSLVDLRRTALTHARPQQLLILFYFLQIIQISPRRDSNSRTNAINISIRGLPLDHRGHCNQDITIL